MKKLFPTLLAATFCAACSGPRPLNEAELRTIEDSPAVMRVLTVRSTDDSLVLRTPCRDFTDRDLRSPAFQALCEKLIATVTDPGQDGVGIAGPQVGLTRRVIAVQRFDKPGAPFEVYANARPKALLGPLVSGREGCLSIPSLWGSVRRHTSIVVSHKNPRTLAQETDTVHGFTAVVFQHELDHLEGVLFTDRADTLIAE